MRRHSDHGSGGSAPTQFPRGIDVVYEDPDFVVVDKPSGMVVHPAPGRSEPAMTDLLVRAYPEMAGVGSRERPGVVHRLDIGTSGAIVFARTQRAYLKLREAFESHVAVKKTYLAILHGAPEQRRGTLDTLIGKRADGKRMRVVEPGGDGLRAVTHWETLRKKGGIALVEFTIETGRTHQIRVHAAHLGHPIAGDDLYGDPTLDRRMAIPPRRLLLHAVQIEFPHPVTGRPVAAVAEPPRDIVFAR